MLRKLLATTALTAVMMGGAYAQETLDTAPDDIDVEVQATESNNGNAVVTPAETGINADGWLATEITGMNLYNSTADDAETIGEVNDFVLAQDGGVAAVIVGVGGFLGIGQHNVAISWDTIELVVDENGNQRLVTSVTREQLENAEEFVRAEWLASERGDDGWFIDNIGDDMIDPAAPADPAMEPADPAMEPADPAMEPADPAMEPADPAAEPLDPAAPADPAMEPVDPAMDPAATNGTIGWDTYVEVPTGEVSVDELTGTTVYGAGDENLGSIGDVILSDSGDVEAVIIDFGGFLGIGTKEVAVSFDELDFLRDENNNLVLRTNLTEEQLEAAPEYDEDAYLAAPGENVITVQ